MDARNCGKTTWLSGILRAPRFEFRVIMGKRWDGNVSRTEVDKFRGAIQGEYEQGIFFTTSDFTKTAMEASIKKGAVPIVLLNGESIVGLMIEKEFGVQRRPLQIYDDQLESVVAEFDGT